MRDALFFSKLRVLLCGWRWKQHRRASWLKARFRQLRRFTRRLSVDPLRSSPILHSPFAIQHSKFNTHTSQFLLEPLEARVLLAADLTGLVQSAALLDPAVPTNNASAVVQVQNVGNQRVNQSQVGVYASLDTTLDASDVLLGTANTGQVNAGASKNVTVNLTIPNTLDPIAYRLLAKMDNANAIAENSETNNVAVGGTVNVAWKFGTVPGRSGNTTLTLRDADGTRVTFSLSGPGLGEVIRDGANWDVKVTGTTAGSAVTILTNSAGNGRVTLNDIHVFGPLSTFLSATTDLTGTLAIDGPVTIPGLLPGTITLGSIQGGTLAVPSVEALTIVGSTTNAKIYVGTTFGQDGQPGGSGANADSYGQGTIGLFTVTGAMSGTAVRVGINPIDGLYGNGNDQLIGGTSSSIGGIIIGGALSADTRFYAGAFPTQYLHGLTLKPTAGDFHFVSNFSGPALTAALQQDTGSSTSDTLTSNPAITGSVTDPQGIATFVAGFGASPTVNVLADRQTDGSFTLSRARLEQINGAPLADGPYSLKLQATDTVGNSTQITVSFTLDTQVPVLLLDLDPASDSAPVGDQQTTNSVVTLAGQTEGNALVELVGLGLTTTADASGNFSFANVALTLGANNFTVRATDTAGNQRNETRAITRMLADSDGDGIPDANEGGGPNGGDANQDGVLDSQQANVASLQNAVDNQYVTLVSPIGTTLVNVQAGAVATGAPSDVTFPFGQIGFEVHGVTPGDSAQVTMLLPTGSLVNSFYKYGPEPGLSPLDQAHWYDFNLNGGTGATISGNTVTLSFIDGARGDADLTANGVIVDPGLPGRSSNQPPVLVPIGTQSVSEGSELRFAVTASDPDVSSNLNIFWSGNLPGAQLEPNGVNNYEFIWTPGETDGPGQYQVEFLVTDGFGPPISEVVTITVNEVNLDPLIFVNGPMTTDEEGFLHFEVRVLDPDIPQNALTLSVTGLPAGAIFTPINSSRYSFDWTPTEAQGPGVYDATFTVSDGQGGVTAQPVSLTVNEVNRQPVIVSIDGPAAVDEETLWQAVVTASDPDLPANTLTASLDAATLALGVTLQPGAAANTWTLQWTPTELQGPGDYTFTVTVSDQVQGAPLTTDQLVTVHVNEVNRPPILAPIGNKTVVEGTRQLTLAPIGNKTVAEDTPGLPTLAFTATATNQGPGVPALTFRATAVDDDVPSNNRTFSLEAPSVVPPGAIGGVPAGAQINGTTGEFVWNLDESHVGNVYAFDVVVADNGTPALNDRETITVTVTGNGQPNNLTFDLENEPAGATINATTGLFEWAPTELQGGASYTFDVVVTDGAEVDRETITIAVNEVNRPPVIESLNAPLAIDELTPWQAVVTASDLDLPANTLTATLAPADLARGAQLVQRGSTNVWDLRWTPTEAQGPDDHTFTVTVSDGQAVPVDQSVTVHVNEVNVAPELALIPAQTMDEMTTRRVTVTATDLDLPANGLTASLVDAPSWAVIQPDSDPLTANTWELVLTPGEAEGSGDYSFTVLVNDDAVGAVNGAGSDSQLVSVHVDEKNLPPVMDTIGDKNWNEGDLHTIVLNATDPDRPVLNMLTYEATGLGGGPLPAGASFDPTTQTFSWRPTEAQGGTGEPFTVVFTVRDNGTPSESASETVSITVNEVNEQPMLAFVPDQTMNEQTERRVPIIVSDPDAPANQLVVELATAPAWTTIEAETDLLTPHAWELVLRPGEAQGPDDYVLNVRVRDNAVGAVNGELTASQFVSVHVNEVNVAPVVSIAGPPTADPGLEWSAVVTASDSDLLANTLTASLDVADVALGAQLIRRGSTNVWDLRWTPSAANGSGGGAPDLSPIGNKVVNENQLLTFVAAATTNPAPDRTFTVTVSDNAVGSVNGPLSASQSVTVDVSEVNLNLVYSLEGQVPDGAHISAAGIFTWTPGVNVGPATFTLDVIVADSGNPSLRDQETITITVPEPKSSFVQGLGDLPGGPFVSAARAVSSGGNFVVGGSRSAESEASFSSGEAFLWSESGGMIGLGDLPGGLFLSGAVGVSGDGTIVVGSGTPDFGLPTAFRWTSGTFTSLLGLPTEPPFSAGNFGATVQSISADGGTIVGSSGTAEGFTGGRIHSEAVRWTGGSVPEALGDIPGGDFDSTAIAVSADGSVIVGTGTSALGFEAFRWSGGSMTGLGDLLGGAFESQALAISADGRTVVGTSRTANGNEAFRWTAQVDMVSLGDLPGNLPGGLLNNGEARAVSGDGSVIVGQSETLFGFEAFYWDAEQGMRRLYDVIATTPGLASEVAGWRLITAEGISADGRVIVGIGENPHGQQEAYRVVLGENVPPVLATIGDKSINEAQLLTFTASAVDPNTEQTLRFSLQGSVPTGASIHQNTGVFTWTPGAAQVGQHVLTIRVSDNGTPAKFDEEIIAVTVNDGNQPPVLAPIADQTVMEGQTGSFIASATDADVPANTLTYSLQGVVPAGAAIDSLTGQFSWTPSAGEAGSYQFTVRVTDNGSPALFSEQTFTVTVLSNAASFQGLGDLPGGLVSSRPFGVSGTGAVVVGESEGASGPESFRWTVGGGIENFSTVVGVPVTARAASSDGSVIVGDSVTGSFRWSATEGLQTIVGDISTHSASAVTPDGSVVVGHGQIDVFTPRGAYRWTSATGAVRLENLPGYLDGEAVAVSSDGNVIVGAAYPFFGSQEAQAVRWVADGFGGFTVEALGDLPGGNVNSRALAVSADGAVIVGVSESDLGPEAFRWTAAEGMQRLGDDTFGGAFGISADGSVIVGGDQGNAFVWDANNGVRNLSGVLFDLGVPGLNVWGTVLSAVGISADGRTIIGEALNPQGDVEAWRAVLPVNASAPEFAAPVNNYQLQAGQNIVFTVSATDGDANQWVQYRLLGNVPSGVTFDTTGLFSWNPNTDDVGVHDFIVRAYDNGVPSRYTDAQFTITVTA